jgi:hypothetical protein
MNIIELARQAGVRDDGRIFEFSEYKYLEAFAELVKKHTLMNIDPKSWMSWQEGYEAGAQKEHKEVERLKALCQEMLSELYVYRASEYLKDVTATIKARGLI